MLSKNRCQRLVPLWESVLIAIVSFHALLCKHVLGGNLWRTTFVRHHVQACRYLEVLWVWCPNPLLRPSFDSALWVQQVKLLPLKKSMCQMSSLITHCLNPTHLNLPIWCSTERIISALEHTMVLGFIHHIISEANEIEQSRITIDFNGCYRFWCINTWCVCRHLRKIP